MSFINFFIKNIVSKNKKLQNIHKSDSCYVFGNGFSLKYYDLKKFSNLKSFTCAWNYLHKDFDYLDICGDFHVHPGMFSPVWKHPYKKNIVFKNDTRKFLFKTNRVNDKNRLFTSILNYPFLINKKNIFYLHHFKKKDLDLNFIDPSDKFSLMFGSFFSMIGVAAYMGFKKIILVGMDYLSNKPKYGHFYEFGIRDQTENMSIYWDKVKYFVNYLEEELKINIDFLTPKNTNCDFLNNIYYQDLFKTNENYKENFEIVEPENLKGLNNIEFEYRIYEK